MPAAKEKTKSRFAKKRTETLPGPIKSPLLLPTTPASRVLGHRSLQILRNAERKRREQPLE